jgi:MFS family permease
MSIFPYIYFMIESFNITKDDRKIAIYAGMVTSSFAFAEFSTGVVWGRLSDRIGRKPVLIMGLAGTGLSMILFGFASSLPVALLARAMGGLLNGNVGVLQTTVAEMITVKEHQPRAYSIMPFVWCLGSIVGPALGGALARPCEAYPWIFSKNTVFERYPFLLPNLVCTVIVLFGVLNGILFLEETHAEKKSRRDVGREVGDWLLRRLRSISKSEESLPEYSALERNPDFYPALFEDEQPPGYRTTEGSPRISTTTLPCQPAGVSKEEPGSLATKPLGMSKAFNRQVIFNIIGYGILA